MNTTNTQQTYCCSTMERHLAKSEVAVIYTPKLREYGILYRDGGSSQRIQYCPWCGKKLPSSLRNEWFDKLDKLGLEPEDELPAELTSDGWWRQ